MLFRLLYAIAVFIITFIVVLFVGLLLSGLKVELLTSIGKFLSVWAVLIAFVAGLLAFLGAGSLPTIRRP